MTHTDSPILATPLYAALAMADGVARPAPPDGYLDLISLIERHPDAVADFVGYAVGVAMQRAAADMPAATPSVDADALAMRQGLRAISASLAVGTSEGLRDAVAAWRTWNTTWGGAA